MKGVLNMLPQKVTVSLSRDFGAYFGQRVLGVLIFPLSQYLQTPLADRGVEHYLEY